MATQKFKPGDKVKFTQKAKDRFWNSVYWHWANSLELDLDKVYTIQSCNYKSWPSYRLKEFSVLSMAEYLLEPAEAEQTKKKNMTKKNFILALVEAILPDQDLTYEGCHPYAQVHTGVDTITVKCPRQYGTIQLTLSPTYRNFEETDIEKVTKFLEQNCNLDCGQDNIVVDGGDLVMSFSDYPWNLVDEIKPTKAKEPAQEDNPCDNCKVVRKLQAEIQRLKYELDQAKAAKFPTKTLPQKGEPWMEKFDLPSGEHGIVFGFGW